MKTSKLVAWIEDGQVWEGNVLPSGAVALPERPEGFYDWNGVAWVENIASKNASINAPVYAQLAEIDQKSIRAIREGDAVRLATLDAQAAALRATLAK